MSLTRASDHFPLKFVTLGSSESRSELSRLRDSAIGSVSAESFFIFVVFPFASQS